MTRLKPRQSPPILLYQGDDIARLSDLHRAWESAAGGNRKDAGAEELAAYNAFVDETAERAVEVVLQSIGPRRWQDLVNEHPPRMVDSEPDDEGKTTKVEHDEDVVHGVNTSTFPRALLMYDDGKAKTIASPEFTDEADRAEFVDDEMAEGDFDRLWNLAWALNTARAYDPKALQPSTDPRSDATTT